MTIFNEQEMERARIEANQRVGLDANILEAASRDLAVQAGLDPDGIMVGVGIPWWKHFARTHEYAIRAYLAATHVSK